MIYRTPVQFNLEEKWVGGWFSTRQVLYLGGTVVAGLVIWGILFFIPWPIRTLFELPVVWMGLRLMSSKKIRRLDLRYDEYLRLRWKYKRKQKVYLYNATPPGK